MKMLRSYFVMLAFPFGRKLINIFDELLLLHNQVHPSVFHRRMVVAIQDLERLSPLADLVHQVRVAEAILADVDQLCHIGPATVTVVLKFKSNLEGGVQAAVLTVAHIFWGNLLSSKFHDVSGADEGRVE
jgi:hypothetical protein